MRTVRRILLWGLGIFVGLPVVVIVLAGIFAGPDQESGDTAASATTTLTATPEPTAIPQPTASPTPAPEPTPTTDFSAETRARSNGVICRSLQQLAREVESGAMATVGEMLQFISDNIEIGASFSSPEIRDAVPKLRSPLEAGDTSGFTEAVNELDDACEKVGGYD